MTFLVQRSKKDLTLICVQIKISNGDNSDLISNWQLTWIHKKYLTSGNGSRFDIDIVSHLWNIEKLIYIHPNIYSQFMTQQLWYFTMCNSENDMSPLIYNVFGPERTHQHLLQRSERAIAKYTLMIESYSISLKCVLYFEWMKNFL